MNKPGMSSGTMETESWITVRWARTRPRPVASPCPQAARPYLSGVVAPRQVSAAVAKSIDCFEQSWIRIISPRSNVATLPATTADLGHIPKQLIRTSRARVFLLPAARRFRLAFRRRLSLFPSAILFRHFRHTSTGPGRCRLRARGKGFFDIDRYGMPSGGLIIRLRLAATRPLPARSRRSPLTAAASAATGTAWPRPPC